MYDLKLDLIKEEIIKVKAKRVLIQLPAGLRVYTREIINVVKQAGADPVIWADSCYGACDLPALPKQQMSKATSCPNEMRTEEPKATYGACDLPQYDYDLLIHFGHDEFISSA
ncbi:MAG: hypothetical protein WC307_03840 [Candidatus Nanoarchaeia archaeon]|jgi:diphthamide synthase subunit DPH2